MKISDNSNLFKCTKCILPADFPNIQFDQNGVCNYCHDWDKKWKNFNYQAAEKELVDIFDKAKTKKRKYDCLVPFSGGRDSSYVLYLSKNKYKLNPLAVTFNNLFMSDYAVKNIFNAVQLLGVDHVFVSFKPDLLKQYYKSMILGGGEFCSVCTAGINYAAIQYQKIFNIPLMIYGTSTRVDEQSPFEINSTHPVYVRKVLANDGFSLPQINELLIKRQYEAGTIEKIKMKLTDADYLKINLPDYVDWNNQMIQDTLNEKLDWQTPDNKKDHIDCRFSSVKYYLKNLIIPHYIFTQEKYSQLIRDGQMNRDEAIQSLRQVIEKEHEVPPIFYEMLKFLDISEQEFENRQRKSHIDYISKEDMQLKESILFKMLSGCWQMVKK